MGTQEVMPIGTFAKHKSWKKMAVGIFCASLFLVCQIAYSAANGLLQKDYPALIAISFGSAAFLFLYLIYTFIQFFGVVMKEL
jgi:hypothetical protein